MDSAAKPVGTSGPAERANYEARAKRHVRALSWTINTLALCFFVLALSSLILWLVPHARVKAVLDSAVAVPGRNGAVVHPTEGGLNAAVERLPFASLFLSICTLALVLLREKLKDFLLAIPLERPRILEAWRKFLPPGIHKQQEIAAVLIIFGIGSFLRLWHL